MRRRTADLAINSTRSPPLCKEIPNVPRPAGGGGVFCRNYLRDPEFIYLFIFISKRSAEQLGGSEHQNVVSSYTKQKNMDSSDSNVALATICCILLLTQESSVVGRVARAHDKGRLEEEENISPWSQGLIQGLARASYFSFPGRQAPYVQRVISVAVLAPGAYAGLSAIHFGAIATRARSEVRRRDGRDGKGLAANPTVLLIAIGIVLPQILGLSGNYDVVGSYYVLAIAVTRLTFLSGLLAPFRSLMWGPLAAATASEAAIDGCFLSNVLLCNASWGVWSVFLQDRYLLAVSTLSVASTLPALLLKLSLRLRLRAANHEDKKSEVEEEGGASAPRRSLSSGQFRCIAAPGKTQSSAAVVDIVLHPDAPPLPTVPPKPMIANTNEVEYKQDEGGDDGESEARPIPMLPQAMPSPVISADVLRLLQPELTTVDGDSLKDASAAQARARSELEKATQPLSVGFFDDPDDGLSAAGAASSIGSSE